MAASTETQRKLRWLFLLIPALSIFCGFGDAPPCDEAINQQAHENLIRSNPVIVRLNNDLRLTSVHAGYCFYKSTVSSQLLYSLPPDWSSMGVIYGGMLNLLYYKDGHFEMLMQNMTNPALLDHDLAIESFKAQILAVENNPPPRVKEFLSKTKPTQGSLISGHFNGQTSEGSWYIQYGLGSQLESWDYILPNSIEWTEFPEIKQANEYVRNNLLVGNLSSCQVTQGGAESWTGGKMWGGGDRTWAMTIPVACEDSRKDLWVRINPDGSMEYLGIRWEAKTK